MKCVYIRDKGFPPFSLSLFTSSPLTDERPCKRREKESWLIYVSTLQVCLLSMFVSETIFLLLSFFLLHLPASPFLIHHSLSILLHAAIQA